MSESGHPYDYPNSAPQPPLRIEAPFMMICASTEREGERLVSGLEVSLRAGGWCEGWCEGWWLECVLEGGVRAGGGRGGMGRE